MRATSVTALVAITVLCLLAVITVTAAPQEESAEWKYQKQAAANADGSSDLNPILLELKKKTFYELLDVPTTAAVNDVRKRFRRLSLSIHPDKAPNAENKKIRELTYPLYVLASDVLTDAMKKRSYDHLLEIGRKPEQITDYDIDNAWDAKRKMWIDEIGWAPLEDWHSLLLIAVITIAGFAYPVHQHLKAEAERKKAKERLVQQSVRLIQNKAKEGAKALSADIAAAKARMAVYKDQEEEEKKTKGASVDRTGGAVDALAQAEAIRAAEAKAKQQAEALAAKERQKQKEEKEKERHEKTKLAVLVLASALSRYRKKIGLTTAQKLKKDREALEKTAKSQRNGSSSSSSNSSSSSSNGSGLPIDPALYAKSYREILLETEIANEDIHGLMKKVTASKLLSMLQSAAQAMGSTHLKMLQSIDVSGGVQGYDVNTAGTAMGDSLTEEQYKKGMAIFFINLDEYVKGKYPDPLVLARPQ